MDYGGERMAEEKTGKRKRTDAVRRAEAKYKASHYKRVSISFPLPEYAALEARAALEGESVASLIRKAVKGYLGDV